MMFNKRIGIESLLAWAFGEELPKFRDETVRSAVGRSGWDAIAEYAALGTLIDRSSGGGGSRIGDGIASGEPHPDAVLVADAVRGLAASELAMPEGFDVLADIDMLTDAERLDCNDRGFAIARAKREELSALIVRRAVIGAPPSWRATGEVKRRSVKGGNGKDAWFRLAMVADPLGGPDFEQEVDGFDKRGQRPHRDAFRKTYLDPDPSLLAADRMDYQAWALGLRLVHEDVQHRLVQHTLTEDLPSLSAWEPDGARSRPRIIFPRKSAERASRAA